MMQFEKNPWRRDQYCQMEIKFENRVCNCARVMWDGKRKKKTLCSFFWFDKQQNPPSSLSAQSTSITQPPCAALPPPESSSVHPHVDSISLSYPSRRKKNSSQGAASLPPPPATITASIYRHLAALASASLAALYLPRISLGLLSLSLGLWWPEITATPPPPLCSTSTVGLHHQQPPSIIHSPPAKCLICVFIAALV